MKDLLVVAYNFPPSSATGIHRTLAFVKYLEPAGWRATVLCAENPVDPERDERLVAQIPESTRVVRTPDVDPLAWLRLRRARVLLAGGPGATPSAEEPKGRGFWWAFKRAVGYRIRPPNWSPGWYRPALRAGRRLLRDRLPDVIYSSGPPWTAHLVAAGLAREFGLPWVADFRDPWVGNPFAKEPFRGLRRRNAAEEARVMARADLVTCVLDTMRDDLLARHPARHPEDVVTISNGFDPAGLAGIHPGIHPGIRPVDQSRLTILHAGQFYGPRRIEPLLAGMQAWFRADPGMANSVRLHLLGGSAEVAAQLRSRVLAAVGGAVEWVAVEPEVPHGEALRRLADAAVLLLVGFGGPGEQYQMTGKIFEYLALRRPILALAPPSCPIGEVLRATGVHHWIVSPDDPAGLLHALRSMAEDWRRGALAGPQSTSSLAAYDRREQTAQLAAVLERAIAARATGKPRARPHGR